MAPGSPTAATNSVWPLSADERGADMSLATRPTWHAETGEWGAQLGDFDLAVSVPFERVLHVTVYPRGERPAPTPAIVDPRRRSLPFETLESATGIRARGGGIDFYFRLFFPHSGDDPGDEGAEVSPPLLGVYAHADAGSEGEENLLLTPLETGWKLEYPLQAEDRCYGLGEKTGYLDRRGRKYTMWNTDDAAPHIETLDPMYVAIPWLVHLERDGSALGLFLDDPTRTVWDLGAADPGKVVVQTPRAAVDLYLVVGPDLGDVVRRYAALTGTMPLPPKWAIGYQQCRYSYISADQVREVASEFRRREIPCDVLYMDIDYMDAYRVFTWDAERFADPKALCADLDAQGFKTVTIVDPGVKKEAGYDVYDDGLARGMYVLDADGVPYVGRVWPGNTVFPDFSRPEVRRWWGDRHRPLFDAGVTGIWNDMNEPSDFSTESKTLPEDARHEEPPVAQRSDRAEAAHPRQTRRHAEVHNLYGLYMGQATREALLAERPDERPFVLSRAGFAGIQRYAATWTGDNFSIWLHLEQALPMALNLGLSGVPFVGPDVGGFSGDTTGELLARWTQLGSVTPFFRNHSNKGTRDQEPWTFGPEIEAICRKYIQLRYALLPYLYTQFRRASEDGLPIMRPLLLEFPDDPELAAIADQALVGPDLMVCPMVRPGATRRAVYFPDGDWYDFWTGARFYGPDWRVARGDLATLPLFARAGAVIPRSQWGPSTALQPRDVLTLEVFPGEDLRGEWYDDDGSSFAYRTGGYALWRFTGGTDEESALRLRLELIHGGFAVPETRLRVVLRGFAAVGRAAFESSQVPWGAIDGDVVVEGPLQAGEWVFEGVSIL
jgi:alpha-glucosidase